MKQILPHHRSTSRAGSAVALTIVASLAFRPVASSKGKPGGGGGEEPSDPGAIDSMPAPINYQVTQIGWYNATQFNDPEFQGINLDTINSKGIAAGFAKLAPASGKTYGERRAGTNAKVQPAEGGGYELNAAI